MPDEVYDLSTNGANQSYVYQKRSMQARKQKSVGDPESAAQGFHDGETDNPCFDRQVRFPNSLQKTTRGIRTRNGQLSPFSV